MKHEAKLTISQPCYSDGRKKISITVYDKKARIEFLELEIDYADFAQCLTGRSRMKCEMEFRGMNEVGKVCETEPLEFEMPEHNYSNRKEIACAEAIRLIPEGWVASEYYGSQTSFFTVDGKPWARTTMDRWV